MQAGKKALGMNPLPTRRLGRGGLNVTALGFGAMGLSAFYGAPKPDPERLAVLDACYSMGEWHWDSADVYADSEQLLGMWFAANPDKRKNVFLATKFGNRRDAEGNLEINSTPAYAKEACAKSLKRLGLPYVDLYYCHRLDGKTPIEQTVRAMAELKEEGTIKYLGPSECSSESLRRAHKVHLISAVQIEYSPWALDIESPQINLLNTCRELGVAVVAYSPIGRGVLSGTIRSRKNLEEGNFRLMSPRFSEENFPNNLKIVDTLQAMAKEHGVTATQLTLTWLLAQGDDIIPIPGTTKTERLEENLGALKVKLTKEEEGKIRKVIEEAEVRGDRYPEGFASALFADTPAEDGQLASKDA